MNAKEKAEELYDKFYAWYPNQDAQFIAKQCASIAVDEIMDYLNKVMIPNPFVQYWNEVKKEIEHL